MKETLVFRVDASSEVGIGHLMRCLALAQGWQDIEGHPIFVMSTGSPALETRLVENKTLRSQMSSQGRRLVDGKGAQRVACEITENGRSCRK